MRTQRYLDFSFEFWAGDGSWFWQLASSSNGRGIVGAARSATEAAREARAMLEEIEPSDWVIDMASTLFESALTWGGILERFERAVGAGTDARQRPATTA
jgi:hypothetical protein